MAILKEKHKTYRASKLAEILCVAVKNVRSTLKKNNIKSITVRGIGGKRKEYLFDALPATWQSQIKYHEDVERLEAAGVTINEAIPSGGLSEFNAITYADAPEYNRRKADKYSLLLHKFSLYDGSELKQKIAEHNTTCEPGLKTSYPAIMKARTAMKQYGFTALIGKHGNTRGKTCVPDNAYKYFRTLYLTEGGPSSASCWRMTAGKYCSDGDITGFPSEDSFLRLINRRVGKSALCLAREGFSRWNRKYSQYIERDYSKIRAGQVWVSDHAQIDVAIKGKNGKAVFGWITSFIDMKTSKALASLFHEEAPNSDHIFQAFFLAADAHGLPEYLYIDNGKDYRCRDFAGGRTYVHRVQVDEKKAQSMLCSLDIIPIFAAPYNAQAKNIEPWHKRIKDGLSKHAVGYRGGNVTERPERLKEDIKRGNIFEFDSFEATLQDFIFNVLNKQPSQGKGCKGLSPDDAWNSEDPVKRIVTRDALKLFCMRTSQPLTISRNGVRYSKFDVTYFDDWMMKVKKTKVYLRIAPDNINDAWVFAQDSDEFLGNARIKGLVHPVAENEIDKTELRAAIADKRREVKAAKDLGYVTNVPDTAERLSAMKTATTLLNPKPVPEPERTVTQILPNSAMQKAVNIRKQRQMEGKSDLSKLARASELAAKRRELEITKNKILHFESEKPQKEAKIQELEAEIERLQAIGQ